jgi:hypothetical protein
MEQVQGVRGSEFGLGPVEFELTLRHPNGHVKSRTRAKDWNSEKSQVWRYKF